MRVAGWQTDKEIELQVSDLTVVAKAFLGPGLICDIDINFMAHFLNYSLRVYYEPMKGSE